MHCFECRVRELHANYSILSDNGTHSCRGGMGDEHTQIAAVCDSNQFKFHQNVKPQMFKYLVSLIRFTKLCAEIDRQNIFHKHDCSLQMLLQALRCAETH